MTPKTATEVLMLHRFWGDKLLQDLSSEVVDDLFNQKKHPDWRHPAIRGDRGASVLFKNLPKI